MQPAIPCIYAQVSPVTGKVRTVGQTTRPLQTRATEHRSHALNGRFVCAGEIEWMRALADEGLEPIIIMLEDLTDRESELDEREVWWIKLGKELKWPLLNESSGGAGSSRPHREETKKRISEGMKRAKAHDYETHTTVTTHTTAPTEARTGRTAHAAPPDTTYQEQT